MNELWEGMRWLAEPHRGPQSFSVALIFLRATSIYVAGWALLRLGGNRFLGQETVFDIVLAFVLGSTLSRAINGTAPLLVTLAAAALLVALHHLFAFVSWRSHQWAKILKGRPKALIQDGRPLIDTLRRLRISAGDLEEALRLNAHLKRPEQVEEARFERNGQISVIPNRWEPRILEVRVQEGVQTVRIELGIAPGLNDHALSPKIGRPAKSRPVREAYRDNPAQGLAAIRSQDRHAAAP